MAIHKLSSQELNKEFAEKKQKIDEIQLMVKDYKAEIDKKLMIINYALEISNNILWAPDFNPTYMDYETLYRKSFLFVVDTAQGIE